MNFVAIDFETANYARDSACAIGLVKVVGGEIVDKAVHLIKPPTREFVFTYIHGLTWNDVATSADFGKLWPTLEPLLEGAEFLAAQNVSFDKRCSSRLPRQLWYRRSVIAVSMHCPDGPARLEHAPDQAVRCLPKAPHRSQQPRTPFGRHGLRTDRSRGQRGG